MKMTPDGQGTLKNYQYVDITESADEHFGLIPDDDDIQLQSPEAIVLNDLLSKLEFLATKYQIIAETHRYNYTGLDSFPGYTKEQSYAAYGIYRTREQEIRELLSQCQPNKK